MMPSTHVRVAAIGRPSDALFPVQNVPVARCIAARGGCYGGSAIDYDPPDHGRAEGVAAVDALNARFFAAFFEVDQRAVHRDDGDRVAGGLLDEAHEVRAVQPHARVAGVGVARDELLLGLENALVEEEADGLLRVVEQPHRRHAARQQLQLLGQVLGEREALLGLLPARGDDGGLEEQGKGKVE